MDKILVIIVTYNGMQWIERCISSVQNSTVKADIYIVDNGSSDGTREYIQKNYPDVILSQSNENLGFGKANNWGFEYAMKNGYDYVYLLNQDAWVYPDTFENLIRYQKLYPEYGILSPFQIQANEEHLDINFKINVCAYYSNPYLLDDLYFNQLKDIYSVPNVMAAHWLISKVCLSKVGAFSPTFPHYGEDDNYCDRTRYHGFKIGICPSVKAVHDRECRKQTKEKSAYISYTSTLARLSNISNPAKLPYIYPIYWIARSCIKCKSLLPIQYIPRIYRSIRTILKNRDISKSDCAFMEY